MEPSINGVCPTEVLSIILRRLVSSSSAHLIASIDLTIALKHGDEFQTQFAGFGHLVNFLASYGSKLLAGVFGLGIYQSIDSGQTWTECKLRTNKHQSASHYIRGRHYYCRVETPVCSEVQTTAYHGNLYKIHSPITTFLHF